ncbi:membrane protein [Yersinia entomophaga]|uniref:Membrane protein n=1 Tax=Yersinia entomophaga TaxID=935293 RepID=A0ABN4PY76_YERET|nr:MULTISPECIES: hypothetical protein [Yersinia]ANI31171.1 membrane protein [Yersinia entomophaga]OWF89969.1 hypothetical protein B4914_00125 [Yersinia entomophaga]
MIDEGPILSRHEFSKKNSKLTLASVAFIIVMTLVIITLATATNVFSTPSILLVLCILLAALSLSVLLYSRLYITPDFTYFLYENGVRVFNHYSEKVYFIPFDKITHIYHFHLGINPRGKINAMAFRASHHQQWNIIVSNIMGANPLMRNIVYQQVSHAGDACLTRLFQGEIINFDVVNKKPSWFNQFIDHDLVEVIPHAIRLNARTLTTQQRVIDIENIRRIETGSKGNNNESIRLLDDEGSVLFSINYAELISADLFIALIQHMIQNRIPAYHSPINH